MVDEGLLHLALEEGSHGGLEELGVPLLHEEVELVAEVLVGKLAIVNGLLLRPIEGQLGQVPEDP